MTSSARYRLGRVHVGKGDPDDAHVTTRCGHCDDAMTGSLGDGRQWYAEHLASEHPDFTPPKPPRNRRRRAARAPA